MIQKAFRFYIQFMLLACEAEEFTLTVEFPDGSRREVYFKKAPDRQLSLLKLDSSSPHSRSSLLGALRPRQKRS